MLDSLKANILFHQLLKRPNIEKAYKMVPPSDSWYDTITTVHRSLAEIRKFPHYDMEVYAEDGAKLCGIFYPGDSDVTVIWVHGYTSHAERESAFPGLFYHSLGYNVLIPYLRAHGPSEGKYISCGALEHREMMKWIEAVNRIFSDGRIVLHGLSMGGGIVLDLTDKQMPNVKCIIADAPSTSITSLFENVSKSVFKKGWQKVYDCCLVRFQKEFGVDAREFDAAKFVKNSKYPIFFTAGSNENMDAVLTSLKDASPMDTEILILPGCNHGNGMYKQTGLYQSALRDFIFKYIAGAMSIT